MSERQPTSNPNGFVPEGFTPQEFGAPDMNAEIAAKEVQLQEAIAKRQEAAQAAYDKSVSEGFMGRPLSENATPRQIRRSIKGDEDLKAYLESRPASEEDLAELTEKRFDNFEQSSQDDKLEGAKAKKLIELYAKSVTESNPTLKQDILDEVHKRAERFTDPQKKIDFLTNYDRRFTSVLRKIEEERGDAPEPTPETPADVSTESEQAPTETGTETADNGTTPETPDQEGAADADQAETPAEAEEVADNAAEASAPDSAEQSSGEQAEEATSAPAGAEDAQQVEDNDTEQAAEDSEATQPMDLDSIEADNQADDAVEPTVEDDADDEENEEDEEDDQAQNDTAEQDVDAEEDEYTGPESERNAGHNGWHASFVSRSVDVNGNANVAPATPDANENSPRFARMRRLGQKVLSAMKWRPGSNAEAQASANTPDQAQSTPETPYGHSDVAELHDMLGEHDSAANARRVDQLQRQAQLEAALENHSEPIPLPISSSSLEGAYGWTHDEAVRVMQEISNQGFGFFGNDDRPDGNRILRVPTGMGDQANQVIRRYNSSRNN